MTDKEPSVVGFFKCIQPITKEVSSNHGYHPEFEKVGENISIQRCYMKKFDRTNLESCYENLRNNIELQGAMCGFIRKETLER
jgi:hypothetical protein